jgi:hypothetical protein
MTAVDLDAVHKMLTEKGVRALEARYGRKFLRNFHGFLSTQLMPNGLLSTQPQQESVGLI